MTSKFVFNLDWLPASHGVPEVRETTALLDITIGDNLATRFEDSWSKSIQRSARLSVYPLALWIASSWWRLMWESLPFQTQPDTCWRMAHEMPAAGYGYLWPLLTFASDGEIVDVICRPSNARSNQPVRYITDFRDAIPIGVFANALDEFVNMVLARLDAVGISGTELHHLWNEVIIERKDPSTSFVRTLEAKLGFEPDEAPETLLTRLVNLAQQAGTGSAHEIAQVCAGSQPEQTLDKIEALAATSGTEAHINIPATLGRPHRTGSITPGRQGEELADRARRVFNLDHNPISNRELAAILAIPPEVLEKGSGTFVSRPLALGVRHERNGGLILLFRKRSTTGLRFEAARFLADQIATPAQEQWLAVADTGTARQKVQRAFAIEFLCPISALDDYLHSDYSPEAIERAGEYFGVSELAVLSHLANHSRIPFDAVAV